MKYQWAIVNRLGYNFPIEIMMEMPVLQIIWSEILNLAEMFQNTGPTQTVLYPVDTLPAQSKCVNEIWQQSTPPITGQPITLAIATICRMCCTITWKSTRSYGLEHGTVKNIATSLTVYNFRAQNWCFTSGKLVCSKAFLLGAFSKRGCSIRDQFSQLIFQSMEVVLRKTFLKICSKIYCSCKNLKWLQWSWMSEKMCTK
jgi:hypothetical protein